MKTDLLFYRELITPEKFSEEIYEDFNRINRSLMQKYELEIPEAIRKYVEFQEGETVKLHEYMAAERNSAEAMYLLGELYKEPFGCSFDDSWYQGNVPEHWNDKTAEKWMKKAMENGRCFCGKTRKPEVIRVIIDDTKIMRYEDWDSYYQHIVLEFAGEMIRKEEFVRHAMLIKHSYFERKDFRTSGESL